MKFPLHPDLVRFEEKECCAIDCAFENPHNAHIVEEFRKVFPAVYIEDKTKLFKDALRISFLYSRFAALAKVVLNLAVSELDFFKEKEDSSILRCGHKVYDHKEALSKVVKALKSREN